MDPGLPAPDWIVKSPRARASSGGHVSFQRAPQRERVAVEIGSTPDLESLSAAGHPRSPRFPTPVPGDKRVPRMKLQVHYSCPLLRGPTRRYGTVRVRYRRRKSLLMRILINDSQTRRAPTTFVDAAQLLP